MNKSSILCKNPTYTQTPTYKDSLQEKVKGDEDMRACTYAISHAEGARKLQVSILSFARNII
jgi:hypothetical protein